MVDVRPEHAADPPADVPNAGPTGHPLFPRAENETGPDLRRIDLIHIERIKEDGTWEACPRVFKAHELQSWKDVVDAFGGGVYRARAQCKKSYQWQGMTERKEFNGPPSRPFCEAAPKPKAVTAPAMDATPAAPPPVAAGYPHGPQGWAPPPGWTPAQGWTPPPGWTGMHAPPPANPSEPPAWVALLLKALDRPQPQANESSLFAVMFRAQAEQNAVMLKAQAERDAMLLKLLVDRPAATVANTNPLEMIREIAPLLKNTTAPGQFMQGVEVAKSLLQQATPAPAQEDFATTIANLMRTLNPQGLAGFPGVGSTPSAPAAPAAQPAAPAAPAAPVLGLEDVIRMAARDRNLAQRFIEEMRRNAAPANDTATPVPAPTSSTSSAPTAAPVPAAAAPANAAPPAAAPTPARVTPPASAAQAPSPRATSSTAAPIPAETPPASRVAGSAISAALAEEQGEELSLSFETLLGAPELQAAMNAAGEEGRRAILMAFLGQTSPGNGPDSGPGRGPEAA